MQTIVKRKSGKMLTPAELAQRKNAAKMSAAKRKRLNALADVAGKKHERGLELTDDEVYANNWRRATVDLERRKKAAKKAKKRGKEYAKLPGKKKLRAAGLNDGEIYMLRAINAGVVFKRLPGVVA
jgi:hypothetical protein